MQDLYKQQILEKLREVEIMLMEATCDGEQLATLDCYSELDSPLSTLIEAVDYYVD